MFGVGGWENIVRTVRQTTFFWIRRVIVAFVFFLFQRQAQQGGGQGGRGGGGSGGSGGGGRGFDPNMRCYQCGDRGHFSRDCEGTKYGYKRPPSPGGESRGDAHFILA